MFNFLADTISKTDKIAFSKGALLSLVAILIVFAVLFMIIGITQLVFKLTGLLDLKKELEAYKNSGEPVKKETEKVYHDTVEITDDDMMVAVLIASIDYQEEIKKDVRLVSVKEVK